MKSGAGGARGRERALLQASRRLNTLLGRAKRLGAPLEALDSVTLLREACGARGLLTGRVLAVCVVSLLVGSVALLAVVCGQLTDLTACRNNSSKELHIQTMSWNKLPDERGVDTPKEASTGVELREYEETSLSSPQMRQRRGR